MTRIIQIVNYASMMRKNNFVQYLSTYEYFHKKIWGISKWEPYPCKLYEYTLADIELVVIIF